MKTTLRIITCGSVDDGKSTMVGRLLQDADLTKEDQLNDAKKAAEATGVNNHMAYMCDGLQEEREKGITIDVAHRYFETDRHKYIIRDCPGHYEFIQNMATGCSQADIAVIMIDSTKGEFVCNDDQTHRHLCIVGMFQIPKVFVCINKLDLEPDVDKRRELFDSIVENLKWHENTFAHNAEFVHIPMSALTGANVVHEDPEMFPWYVGDTLFNALENIDEVENPLRDATPAFQVTHVTTVGYTGAYVQGKMLTGCFEQNSKLGVDGGDCNMKLVSINIGANDTFLLTETGLSYTLKVEGDITALKPGCILHTYSGMRLPSTLPTTANWYIRFLWVGDMHTNDVNLLAQVHGATGKISWKCDSFYARGDMAVRRARSDDFPYVHIYGKARNPLGAMVLVDPETKKTQAVAVLLASNDYLVQRMIADGEL